MCSVDPAAVLTWEVTGVTPPLEGAISRWETARSFTYPNVIGQSTLNVNDPSRIDVENQTCFICRAEYLSRNIIRSDPLCVDAAGTLILDLTLIVYSSTKMAVVGSKKRLLYSEPFYMGSVGLNQSKSIYIVPNLSSVIEVLWDFNLLHSVSIPVLTGACVIYTVSTSECLYSASCNISD